MSITVTPAPPSDRRRGGVRLRPGLATWLVPVLGAAVLIVLGLLVAVATPPGPPRPVPDSVVQGELARTTGAAQSVRRSLNEAVDDLQVAARTALDGSADGSAIQPVLDAFVTQRGRYHGVAWVRGGEVTVRAGADFPVPLPLAPGQSVVASGTRDNEPFVVLATAVPGQPDTWLVAWYDAAYLTYPLVAAGPGDRWLVDDADLVLGSVDGFVALEPLPSPAEVLAADAARTGAAHAADVTASEAVISAAPVRGEGPAGGLGWVVVTSSGYADLAITDETARNELVLAGVLTAVVAAILLGWFLVAVAIPAHHLAADAVALADGDLGRPVMVRRYDELGVIGRNLDRVRRTLRGEYGGPRPPEGGN